MVRRSLSRSAWGAALLLALAVPALGAPRDAKVGDVRAVFNRQGTPLKETPAALAAPTATLAYGTQVRVLEIQKGWLRVATVAGGPQGGQTGWLKAYETVEPEALRGSPPPPHSASPGSAGVSSREVSAAGRQLDEETERGYRRSRTDLATAYRLVDRMEAETQALDPADSMVFIAEGGLGRMGRDYARPGRVAAQPPPRRSRAPARGAGGLFGKLGGEVLRRAGAGDTAARVAESLVSSAMDTVDQVKEKFTPQQEYYLGRAVAAQAIARYGVDADEGRRRYVRLVGDAVVRLSSRLPPNFGGYHFEVLDTDEVNGISGPGGFVLVTRGAVLACRDEAQLAGILAHELAHIRDQHGEKVLRQGKEFPGMVKGLSSVAGALAGAAGAGQWAQGLVQFFGQAVTQMSSTAIDHGYGRTLEFAADAEGTNLLFDVYYDQAALRAFLANLATAHRHHGGGATHADPAVRAQALDPVIARYRPYEPGDDAPVREARFAAALGAGAPPR